VIEGINSVTYNLVFNNVPLGGICFVGELAGLGVGIGIGIGIEFDCDPDTDPDPE